MSVLVPITIEIVRGDRADALLADAAFVAQWQALCDACPWSTPFQAPPFATTWYRVYREHWEPMLLLSRDDAGALQGFLPLAVSLRGRDVALAGAQQAEYQTWIALPQLGDAFIWQAIQSLRWEIPRATLSFHYLPPESPRGWLDDPAAARTCSLRTHRRPLMQFGDGSDVKESLAKRGNKGRLRRLGRYGKVELKQITTAEAMERLKDEVTLFYDMRRMAVNNASPFASDPLKWAFHVEMLEAPALAHVTALMCGDRVASFHLNTLFRKHCQLSLITHNPLWADYSPGKFHILLLARLLHEQGYEWIDLTPGGDPYKERFANGWDEVYSLTVHATPIERRTWAFKDSLAERAKTALHRWNIRPAEAEETVRKYAKPSALLHLARNWLSSSQEAMIYSRDVTKNGIAESKLIRKNELKDLMLYEPDAGGPTRHEFLSHAMRRLEQNQYCYTHAEGGRLLHYAWLAPEPSKDVAAEMLSGFVLPEKSSLIVACYTTPAARGRGLATASLAAMLRDASYTEGIAKAFITVPTASSVARHLVERAGFRYVHSCVRDFAGV
jgi:CelD/BcsL family acetyltransferase involved in cellulose biosynthesis/GNAT superfamily N-acetyltransferase